MFYCQKCIKFINKALKKCIKKHDTKRHKTSKFNRLCKVKKKKGEGTYTSITYINKQKHTKLCKEANSLSHKIFS